MPDIKIIAAAAIAAMIIVIKIIRICISKKRRPHEETSPLPDTDTVLSDDVPETAAETGFVLLENTVIVHTDEKISG